MSVRDGEYERRPIPLPGFDLYQIDSNGHVWCFGPMTLGKQQRGEYTPQAGGKDHKGYVRASFWINQKSVNFLIHYLVALSFHGPRPVEPKIGEITVRATHLDGDKSNNKASNIYWYVQRHDPRLRFRSRELYNDGETDPARLLEKHKQVLLANRPFKAEQIRHIRQLLASGRSRREVAAIFHCSPSTIASIERGASYADIT